MTPGKVYCARMEGGAGCGEYAPVDHWSSGACPNPPMPLPFILGIMADKAADTEHAEGNLTATRISRCPRATLIEDFIGPDAPGGGLAFNPVRWNSATWGTALHEWMAKHSPPGSLVEVRWPRPDAQAIVLDFGEGVKAPVSAQADFLPADKAVVVDYKCHSESAQLTKWWFRGKPDEDLVIQFNVIRTLVEAEWPDAKVEKGVFWHGAMTPEMRTLPGCKGCGAPKRKMPFEAPPWFVQEIPRVSLQELGGTKPKGGRTTLREIVSMLLWGREEIRVVSAAVKRGTPEWYAKVNGIINTLPMVGEQMYRGDMCLVYCGAPQDYCFGIAGRAKTL